MKIKFTPPPTALFYLFAILLVFNYSCKKETKEIAQLENVSAELNQNMQQRGGSCFDVMENDLDTSDAVTVLGNQLIGNPYSVSVMQQASTNLYGNTNGIAVNKLYVKFKPADVNQLLALEA